MQVWINPRYDINHSLTVRWSNRGGDNRNGREGGNNQNESGGGGNDELVEATQTIYRLPRCSLPFPCSTPGLVRSTNPALRREASVGLLNKEITWADRNISRGFLPEPNEGIVCL